VTADLASWLTHPVTLGLVGVGLLLLFSICEALLRGLAQLGNVRFQGILEAHPRMFPIVGDDGLHLSRLLDSLRWIQLGALGALWVVVFRFPGIQILPAVAVAVAVPLCAVALTRAVARGLGEDSLAMLLTAVRPLTWPTVRLLARSAPPPRTPEPEEEEEEATEREIQAYLEAGHLAGIFERDEGEFLESLVEFFDTVVREVMTPRTDMVAIADTATFDELLHAFADSHKSRIPVYHETVDRVVGVLHVKNLVKHVLRGKKPPIEDLLRDVLVVPESKPLGELLRDFQREHQQLAIVVDEYGGTSGLVTLEDVLEEIVGEIQDEHDPREPPEVEELEPGVFRLRGRAPLEVLEDLFDVETEEEDVDTVGDFVFSRHGTVPETGTEVVDPERKLAFTIDEMDERRIVAVVVRRVENVRAAEQAVGEG